MWEFILFVSIVAAAIILGMYLNTRIEAAIKKSNQVKCKICNKEYTGYYGPDIPYICVFCRDQVESNQLDIPRCSKCGVELGEVPWMPFICKPCAKQIESNLSNIQKKHRIKGRLEP